MQLLQINNILQQFSLEAFDFKDISEKGFSGAEIYKIHTSNGEYVLKGYSLSTEESHLKFIQEVMETAYKNGFRKLPHLFKTSSGQFSLKRDGRLWEVMSLIEGSPLDEMPNETQCVELGKAIAELHQSLRNFPENKLLRRRGHTTFDSLLLRHKQMKEEINNNASLLKNAGVLELIIPFISLSEEILLGNFIPTEFDELQQKIPRLVIHQDLWGSNVFFRGDTHTGFIDFEFAKHCARLDEIAKTVIELLSVSEKETSIFLTAYNSIWKFTDSELTLLPMWIFNWVIFSPFWHIERFIQKEVENPGAKTRVEEMVKRSYTILTRHNEGKLAFLSKGKFLK